MKQITVLAVSLTALSLSACATPVSVPLARLGNLPQEEKSAVLGMPIYNEAQLIGKNYTVLGMVEGHSCKLKESAPAASKLEAVDQLKYWALHQGADALVNVQCDPPRAIPLMAYNSNGCLESVTCMAQAVRLSQN